MKKISFLFVSVLFLASCSNQGAFTEEEKKEQDSIDQSSQSEQFDELESLENTTDSNGAENKSEAEIPKNEASEPAQSPKN